MKRKVITLLLIAILTLTAFGTVALTTSQKVEAANSSAVPATSQKVEAANSSAVPVETPILSAVWSAWTSLSGQLTASPGAVSWADGRTDVFARGTDNALWHRSYNNNAWSSWEYLSGQLAPTTGPAASSQRAGQLDVFVIGTDNALWHRTYA